MTQSAELRDGRHVTVREVGPEDEAVLLEFLERMSPGNLRLRFFTGGSDLRRTARWAAGADGVRHCALLALDESGRVVGHALYVCLGDEPRAEVAVEVADDLHHQGLATVLLIRLARHAEEAGVERFVAQVLPENHDMLAVFADGFASERQSDDGEVHVEYLTSSWRLAEARFGTPAGAP